MIKTKRVIGIFLVILGFVLGAVNFRLLLGAYPAALLR
jgi:hypothetical protein